MPIIRAHQKQIYYAHIPKCAGSSVEDYLADRFGHLALLDRRYLSVPEPDRWSHTSPQHIDWASLSRLFPLDYFDECFAIVRHPVARAVSAFRFQKEVEGTIPDGTALGEWLQQEQELRATDPHRSDNHSRPQVEFLPPESGMHCQIFCLEHGLEALIPYFDQIAGDQASPRFIDHTNKAAGKPKGQEQVAPTDADLARIAEIYAADFERLGYLPDNPKPLKDVPEVNTDFLAQSRAAKARAAKPLNKLMIKALRRLQSQS